MERPYLSPLRHGAHFIDPAGRNLLRADGVGMSRAHGHGQEPIIVWAANVRYYTDGIA